MKLTRSQRIAARKNILAGAAMMLRNPAGIHYTQGGRRWEGIDRRLRVVRHDYPHYADCSSMATWMLWNALTHALRDLTIPDVVNGANWQAGFTGTMVRHGRPIDELTQPGDCAFYGSPPSFGHVAVYLGRGYVFSHGSEAGPYKLGPHYRSDLRKMRRYIVG